MEGTANAGQKQSGSLLARARTYPQACGRAGAAISRFLARARIGNADQLTARLIAIRHPGGNLEAIIHGQRVELVRCPRCQVKTAMSPELLKGHLEGWHGRPLDEWRDDYWKSATPKRRGRPRGPTRARMGATVEKKQGIHNQGGPTR